MANNLNRNQNSLQNSHVIYEFTLQEGGCKLPNNIKYVGAATTTAASQEVSPGISNRVHPSCSGKTITIPT